MTDRIAELEQQLAQARDHIAELEAYALGCDAEGCTVPHSSWCDVAKKTAAENGGCTCPQPWKDSPQPHAGYCWLVSPPRDEVEQARKRIAELIAERNGLADRVDTLTAVAKGNKRHVTELFTDLQKAQRELAEMTRLRDNAVRALNRDDVDTDPHLPDLFADGLHGLYEWETQPEPDQAPAELVDRCVKIAQPALGKLTQQRDQARGIAVALEQELATYTATALPWAHTMDDSDLHLFLDDLVCATIDRWRSDPDVPGRQILANVEKVCANWRTPGQGYRSDEDEAGEGQ